MEWFPFAIYYGLLENATKRLLELSHLEFKKGKTPTSIWLPVTDIKKEEMHQFASSGKC